MSKRIRSFFKPFFSFRLITLAGMGVGLWLFSVQTEQIPLSALLTETRVYFIPFLIVLGFHILLWIFIEKASLYNIGNYFWGIIRDTVVINCVVLSTVATCFLLTTFVF